MTTSRPDVGTATWRCAPNLVQSCVPVRTENVVAEEGVLAHGDLPGREVEQRVVDHRGGGDVQARRIAVHEGRNSAGSSVFLAPDGRPTAHAPRRNMPASPRRRAPPGHASDICVPFHRRRGPHPARFRYSCPRLPASVTGQRPGVHPACAAAIASQLCLAAAARPAAVSRSAKARSLSTRPSASLSAAVSRGGTRSTRRPRSACAPRRGCGGHDRHPGRERGEQRTGLAGDAGVERNAATSAACSSRETSAAGR